MTGQVNKSELETLKAFDPVYELIRPAKPSPVIVTSPHSGRIYPPGFLKGSRLPESILRQAEDAYVDQICADAPKKGAALMCARFPRSFLDLNRAEDELDPSWLTEGEGTLTPRASAGLGIVPRIIAEGVNIYDTPLPRHIGEARIAALHRPWHRQLQSLIDAAKARFGYAILLDMHSMPGIGPNYMPLPDMVLGNRFGTSCAPAMTRLAEKALSEMGYRVARNHPYAGGYTSAHYGQPENRVHALQIEINRDLYMSPVDLQLKDGFPGVKANISRLIRRIVRASDGF